MVGRGTLAFMVTAMTLALGLSGSPSLAQSTSATPAEGPRGKAALEVRGKFIDQRIAEFMEKHDVPGLAMAIVQAPYIPRSAGYGRASLTHDELASTRTTWNLGPLTQGFTAVAIFQLHETQKLDIHDAIDKHLPARLRPGRRPRCWNSCSMLQAFPTIGQLLASTRVALISRLSCWRRYPRRRFCSSAAARCG